MSSEELKPCPFCGGDVSFHKDEECPGCHLIQCGQCRAFFDFATWADPGNDCASVDALRAAIAPMWNTRAQHQRITAAMAAEEQTWKQLHAEAQELYADAMIAIGKELGIDVSDEPRCKHVSAQAMAMAAEVERLREERDSFQRVGILATEERDALRAELAITRRVIDRIGQLCTTPHESKERFIRRVQSVIEWEAQAISAKASP